MARFRNSDDDEKEARIAELEERVATLETALDVIWTDYEELAEEVHALREGERQAQVNKERLDELKLAVESKVGRSMFETLQEQVRQIRARTDFISDALDAEWRQAMKQETGETGGDQQDI